MQPMSHDTSTFFTSWGSGILGNIIMKSMSNPC